MGDVAAWPVPRASWRARRYCLTKLTDKTVPYQGDTLEMAYDQSNTPSFDRRVGKLRRGKSLTLTVLVEGRLPWCPPFAGGHPVRLTADGAVTDAGGGPSTVRPIPLTDLRVTDARLLDPPTRPMVPGLETWTLTVSQSAGTAQITGLLCDLALLAYVAGWTAPAEVAHDDHAGAVGAHPGPAPRRPPIRPLGWVLVAAGMLVAVGAIVGLAFSSSTHGSMTGVGGLAGLLMLSGSQTRRRSRREPPDDPSAR